MVGSQGDDFGVGGGSCFQIIEHVLTLSVLEPDPSLGVLVGLNKSGEEGKSLAILICNITRIKLYACTCVLEISIDASCMIVSHYFPCTHQQCPDTDHHNLLH